MSARVAVFDAPSCQIEFEDTFVLTLLYVVSDQYMETITILSAINRSIEELETARATSPR